MQAKTIQLTLSPHGPFYSDTDGNYLMCKSAAEVFCGEPPLNAVLHFSRMPFKDSVKVVRQSNNWLSFKKRSFPTTVDLERRLLQLHITFPLYVKLSPSI